MNLQRQRGVAVVTALLLTTLAVTIVASLFWQQQVQVRTIENQRLQQQAKWVLLGSLDWARLILREDAKHSSIDHLGEPWATPLAETRLDDYLEKGSSDSGAAQAAISGQIVDAQSRFNLTNLASGKAVNASEVAVFERLLASLSLSPSLARKAAETVTAAQPGGVTAPDGSQSGSQRDNQSGKQESPPALSLGLTRVDDLLAVPGFSPEIVAVLKDFVVVLPRFTPINVNTASAEVLAARIGKLSLSEAKALIVSREQAYFRDTADFPQRLPSGSQQSAGMSEIAVSTSYFIIQGKVRVDRASQQIEALVERGNSGISIIWIRDY